MTNIFREVLILSALFININIAKAQIMNELSQKQQSIAEIASFTAIGDIKGLKTTLNESLDNGLSINEAKEVLTQMYAYAGFPRALNGTATLMEILNERKVKGIKDKIGTEPNVLDMGEDKWAYGNKVQIELTGTEVKGGLMDFSPAMNQYLKEHLFGDIFARGVLSFQDREVATIAALTAMDGVDSQLNSHKTMGKNTGLTDMQISEITSIVNNKVKPLEMVFAKGDVNPYGKYFTGQTYLTMLSPNDDRFNAPIGNVTFEPGARTHWHKHSGGQILLVTAGEGRYQPRGGKIQVLKKGDVVRIDPNIEHWHGAAPNAWFSHVSVETNVPNNTVTWLEPVTDEQYK